MCRTYSCYRDEQRKPNVALLTEVQSDEPNGLEVSFTIEDKWREFQEEAVNVFRYWSYTPNINNQSVVDQVAERRSKYKFCGEDFGLTSSWGSMVAIMGNVAYTIPDELDEFDTDGYLRFDLGEISFDAGRESLSLDDRTKAAIKAKFQSVKNKLALEAEKQLNDLPTAWERANLAHELGTGQLGRFIKADLKKYELPEPQEEIMYFVRSYRSTDKSETKRLPLGSEIDYYEFKPRMQSRIRSYIKDFSRKTMVLLTKEQIKELEVPTDALLDLDDLPKVYRSTGSAGSTVKTFTFDKSHTGWRKDRDFWDENTTEVDGSEMVYVEINRFSPCGSSVGRIFDLNSNRGIKRAIDSMEQAGITVPTIHGLKSAHLSTKAFKNGNYTTLSEFMIREVKKIALKTKPVYDDCDYELVQALAKCYEHEDLTLWSELNALKPDRNLLSLCRMCDLEMEEDTLIQELHEQFFKQYPMIKLLSYYDVTNKKNKETIAQYINGVIKND